MDPVIDLPVKEMVSLAWEEGTSSSNASVMEGPMPCHMYHSCIQDTILHRIKHEKIFNGKLAVITGGASGVGFAIGEALAKEGAKSNSYRRRRRKSSKIYCNAN